MTEKELKKMSRAELLELLIEQMEENVRLQQELNRVTAELDNRQILLQNAGSIAQAALELNKVFEAADAAARQYVESICRLVDEEKRNADERKSGHGEKA
ncbi:MAG: DNA repair protein [Clostridia bacterium]|nr:DNA repair protein [Clostridia bacterium]